MANDAPQLRGYTFSKPPDQYEVWWDKVTVNHTLADGSMRKYTKGFLLKFRFGWSKNWLNNDDYSNIAVMYNDASGMTLYPRPNTYSGLSYTVQLTNDFNMLPWHDLLEDTTRQGYEGKIEGEGLYVTASCNPWV